MRAIRRASELGEIRRQVRILGDATLEISQHPIEISFHRIAAPFSPEREFDFSVAGAVEDRPLVLLAEIAPGRGEIKAQVVRQGGQYILVVLSVAPALPRCDGSFRE